MRRARWAALALLLAGWAMEPPGWEKPGADDDRRALDLAECASLARNEMRSHRGLAREGASEPDTATIGRDEDAAVTRRLREADAQARRGELISDCMRAKGYAPAREAAGRSA
jgi:hypothetical protein